MYESGVLACEGYQPLAVPKELVALREECGAGPVLPASEFIRFDEVDGERVAVIPDEATLPVVLDDEGRKRLLGLAAQYGNGRRSKKARLSETLPPLDPVVFPDCCDDLEKILRPNGSTRQRSSSPARWAR